MKSEREIQIDEKYKNLQNKIFYLTNKDLSIDNERTENLQYNINKLNEDINSSMNNYNNKIKYIKNSLESLNEILKSKKLIQQNFETKKEKKFNLYENNIINKIKEHKEFMINEINNIFNEIENNFNEFVKQQKNEKLKVTENLNKLINLINFE